MRAGLRNAAVRDEGLFLLQQAQKAVENMEMVLKALVFQIHECVDADPFGLRGIVIGQHMGKRPVAQVEKMHMGDGASPLAARRVVKHPHGLEGLRQCFRRQIAMGFSRNPPGNASRPRPGAWARRISST